MNTSANSATPKLRTDAAAKYLGVSSSTLEKLRLTGGGPTYAKLGRTVVYDQSSLEEWVGANLRKSTSVAA